MKNKIYITGIGGISAQKNDFAENPLVYEQLIFKAHTPNFKEFIKPMALRRMSQAVKMGVTTALLALKDAKVELPEAIITGTGEGCKKDTERFLEKLLDQREDLLNPTPFIQSTHNTIGGQIALHLGCKNYNVTYSQNSASLESAFIDAQLLLSENPKSNNILVGGVDEVSEVISGFRNLDQQLKTKKIKNLDLFKDDSPGTIASEGSHFFLLTSEIKESTYAELIDLGIINSVSTQGLTSEVESFLTNNQLKPEDIDVVILGNNGDNRFDHFYENLQQGIFKNTQQLVYKHLIGEYETATGFAFLLAANILKSGEIPGILKANNIPEVKTKNILIYNQYLARDHSLSLLRAV
ncbi:3-oxoacyl-(acyl-carrier-protein) synthase [Salegentibacter echinorum]|uniref:3-oxoacyl-(Acyl-carrier-protein) synthase n=1 Tax=Salegentibacter echinorum TaxID=1073325 RepID=A0A1M5FUL8_SALEC|nr:beta-ketoacyl synthase chain length factor [Salegentibacter echinorum]SHF94882.1 3-oxoacyl-(acyl-carrier-protein) synthase [Salegentibacter echinorum]